MTESSTPNTDRYDPPEAAHRALWNIASLHRPRPVQFESFSVCMECEGTPEWPCETVRIVQEVVTEDLTFPGQES